MSSWLLWKGYSRTSTWRWWNAAVFLGLRSWINMHVCVVTLVKLKMLGGDFAGLSCSCGCKKESSRLLLTHAVFSRGAPRILLCARCLEGTGFCLKLTIFSAPSLRQTTQNTPFWEGLNQRREAGACVTPSPHSWNHDATSQSLRQRVGRWGTAGELPWPWRMTTLPTCMSSCWISVSRLLTCLLDEQKPL